MNRDHILSALTLCITLAVIFLCAEAYVRLYVDDGMQFDLEMWKYARLVKEPSNDPRLGYVHAANRHLRLMGVEFNTNSKGLRDREFDYARTPGTLRIVMLGDSLTVGWGVPLEETFPKRIEGKYRDINVAAEVINTGVGNYNSIQEVEYFMQEARKYSPDIVVLNFFVNDAEPTPKSRRTNLFDVICSSCIFLAGRLDTARRLISADQDWAGYYLDLYRDGSTKGWLDAKQAIKNLASYCKANKIVLLIASLPELHDVKNYRFQRVTDLLRQTAAETDTPFVDLLPYLQDQEASTLWVSPTDPHPNGFADALIANGLFAALHNLPGAVQ